jgi:hypothetical protein
VCSLFAVKATVVLGEMTWILRFLQILFVTIVLIYTVLVILQLSEADPTVSCHDVYWVIYAAINSCISFIFVAVGYQINSIAKLQLENRKNRIQTDFQVSKALGERSQTEVARADESVRLALFKMWVIIISLTFTNLFIYIYS